MTTTERLDSMADYLGISIKTMSERCGYDRPQAFYDVRNGKTKEFSPRMCDKIISAFPVFNRTWILTGEGEMLKSSNHQIINSPVGDHSTQIAGNSVTENSSLNKALDELSEMRKLLAEAIRNNKEQADRFFTIIENIQKP